MVGLAGEIGPAIKAALTLKMLLGEQTEAGE
jgi:hypothetical protein